GYEGVPDPGADVDAGQQWRQSGRKASKLMEQAHPSRAWMGRPIILVGLSGVLGGALWAGCLGLGCGAAALLCCRGWRRAGDWSRRGCRRRHSFQLCLQVSDTALLGFRSGLESIANGASCVTDAG